MAWKASPMRAVESAVWLCGLAVVTQWLVQDLATSNTHRLVVDSLLLGWGCWILWTTVQGYRRDPLALRIELLDAARKVRRHEVWLCRDDHVIFTARRFLGLHLRVMNEDDFRDISGAGSTVVYATMLVPLFDTDVMRVVDGSVYRQGPDGIDRAVSDRGGFIRGWADAGRLAWFQARTGRLSASPEEIREVIRQLDRAELLGEMPPGQRA